jgi:hypothetical protein
MDVSEVIHVLQGMPPHAEVWLNLLVPPEVAEEYERTTQPVCAIEIDSVGDVVMRGEDDE